MATDSMSKVQLTTTAEVRAQILQLIALEKLENNKDYTIKSYLEMLVGLAARGKFDEAGKLNIEVKREPIELRADRAMLLAAVAKLPDLSLKEATEGETQLRAVTPNEDRLLGENMYQQVEFSHPDGWWMDTWKAMPAPKPGAIDQVAAEIRVADLSTAKALDEYRILYLGRKGRLANLFDRLKEVPTEELPEAKRLLNRLKEFAQRRWDQARAALENN